ncbi:hypothetical protein CGRA01v4_11340 [Colletotrichum graminicola]|nr:hypothetical protein CGRA01v4_11340 [Colletotrichum graminicola]
MVCSFVRELPTPSFCAGKPPCTPKDPSLLKGGQST